MGASGSRKTLKACSHRQMSKIGSMSAGALRALARARLGAAVRGAGSGRPGAQFMGEGAGPRHSGVMSVLVMVG